MDGTWTVYNDKTRPKTPLIVVRKEDHDSITRSLERMREVILEADIENRIIPGPFKLTNVIAELKGSEKPDEVIVVCGHLDSWDGPGSQGACDNATGVSVTIEAARILTAAGIRPKRTIRFILWGGEEQGLLGSAAHVKALREAGQIDKVSVVFNEDAGTTYHGGVRALESMKALFETGIQRMNMAFPDLPMQFNLVEQLGMGGSDHNSFLQAGVPAFQWSKAGQADYRHVWHTQNDRYEFAIGKYLTQASTNSALMALIFADADHLLPRVVPGPRRARGTGGVSDDHDHDHDPQMLLIHSWR